MLAVCRNPQSWLNAFVIRMNFKLLKQVLLLHIQTFGVNSCEQSHGLCFSLSVTSSLSVNNNMASILAWLWTTTGPMFQEYCEHPQGPCSRTIMSNHISLMGVLSWTITYLVDCEQLHKSKINNSSSVMNHLSLYSRRTVNHRSLIVSSVMNNLWAFMNDHTTYIIGLLWTTRYY